MKYLFSFILFLFYLTACNNFDAQKEIADEKTEQIAGMIETLEKYAEETTEKFIPLFTDPESYKEGLYDDAVYDYIDDVMYHNRENQGYGKFLYSGYFPVGEKERQKVKILEHAIPELKWLIHDSEYADYIVQTYLITFDTLIVFYPWSDLISFIPPKRNIMDRGGWKTLNRETNPERGLKWTPPYVDTTGKGFVVDIMIPLDNGDVMEAFFGIDITISKLKKKFFDEEKEKMLLVDKTTSQIIAISNTAEDLLGVENAEAFRYLDMVDNSEIYRQVMPENLVLEKTESIHMKELWSKINSAEEYTIVIENKEHRVYRNFIEGPQWFLLLIE